jgi:hypothetical protein
MFHTEHVLPPELSFSREVMESAVYPYRHPLDSITRIFLIHLISHMSPEQREDFSNRLKDASTHFPSNYCQLYGPKFVARPGQLSPGEYEQLVQLMPMYVTPGPRDGTSWAVEEVKDRWIALCVAQERLYGVRKKTI